jgi:uncharacterized coiled-coil protein SlyX
MSIEDRVTELEVRIAFQEDSIATLSLALAERDRAIRTLEDDVRAVREAMRRMSATMPDDKSEIVGKYDVDDPVPRAG